MCADSNTVFHDVEETKSYSRKTKMKIGTQLRARPVLFAVVVAFGLGLASYPAEAQSHRAVNLSAAKDLPFSDGVTAGKTLYIAGQEGSDDSGKLAAGGIGPETSAALDNVQKVLKAAGFELKDVVSVTVYLADIHEFPDMNKVYKSVMPDPKPARATVQAAALVNNARIEISAIAVKQK
jgi:2-iminobutanoate/2-iminopropanoate deaminase